MLNEWTLLKADRDVGSWTPNGGSKFTLETYTITKHGTWVPTVNVDWLLTFKYVCPCKMNAPVEQRKRIKMFARIGGTREQHKEKPDRPPMMREAELSNFGLKRVK